MKFPKFARDMDLNPDDTQVSRQALLAFPMRYGLAIASTALAALARYLLPEALTPAPYLGFYPAVVVSAALGGVGPGLVATFGSLLLVNFVFGSFDIHNHGSMARQLIWVTASIGVSLLAGMQRAAQMRERLQTDELRRTIDERKRAEEKLRETASELHAANIELDNSRRAAINLLKDALDARQQAEGAATALRESEEQFRTLADTIPQLCWMANADGWIFWYNQRWYEYTGTTPEQMEGWGWQSVHDPQALPDVVEQWQISLSTGKPFDMVFPLRGSDGVFRPFLTRVMPVRDQGGNVVRWFGTNTDISEQRQAAEVLQASLQRFYYVLASMYSGILLVTDQGCVEFANQSFCDLFGLDDAPAGLVGRAAGETLEKIKHAYLNPEEAFARIREIVEQGQPVRSEELSMQDGAIWLRDFIPLSVHGKSHGRLWIHLDITEHKRAEEALQQAHHELAIQMAERTAELHEKEVLLKEIHHRVKNNLQVISSLVSLQAEGAKDNTVREGLQDVTYRVRSMALVHEKLYQSEDLARIDFAEYTRSLLNYLWRAYGVAAAAVRLRFELEPLALPVDIAVPCGLILNELAGNALKHAFPGHSEGEVTVSLCGSVEGTVRLSLRDNGIGLPSEPDWRQSGSLGLRLVQMLAKQLRATVELNRDGGTEFQIIFRLQEGR